MPHLALRVGAMSGRLQRGRHTTRHVELFRLPLALEWLIPLIQPTDRWMILRNWVVSRAACPAQPWPCRFRNCLQTGTRLWDQQDWERFALYKNALQECSDLSRPSRAD